MGLDGLAARWLRALGFWAWEDVIIWNTTESNAPSMDENKWNNASKETEIIPTPEETPEWRAMRVKVKTESEILMWDIWEEEEETSNYEDFDRDIKEWEAIPFNKIRSHWREYSNKWTTLCSTTVQKDAEKIFNIKLSWWHGSAQWELDNYDTHGRNTSCKIDKNKLTSLNYKQIEESMKWDVFDIFTKSNNNPQYNHRLLWFRLRTWTWNKIRVLDSYIKWVWSIKPIPFEEYYNKVCIWMKRPLLGIYWFDTKREVFKEEDILADNTKQAKQEAMLS